MESVDLVEELGIFSKMIQKYILCISRIIQKKVNLADFWNATMKKQLIFLLILTPLMCCVRKPFVDYDCYHKYLDETPEPQRKIFEGTDLAKWYILRNVNIDISFFRQDSGCLDKLKDYLKLGNEEYIVYPDYYISPGHKSAITNHFTIMNKINNSLNISKSIIFNINPRLETNVICTFDSLYYIENGVIHAVDKCGNVRSFYGIWYCDIDTIDVRGFFRLKARIDKELMEANRRYLEIVGQKG